MRTRAHTHTYIQNRYTYIYVHQLYIRRIRILCVMYCLQNVRRCTCSFFHWPLAEGMPKDASKSLASVAADQLMARRIPVGSAVVL